MPLFHFGIFHLFIPLAFEVDVLYSDVIWYIYYLINFQRASDFNDTLVAFLSTLILIMFNNSSTYIPYSCNFIIWCLMKNQICILQGNCPLTINPHSFWSCIRGHEPWFLQSWNLYFLVPYKTLANTFFIQPVNDCAFIPHSPTLKHNLVYKFSLKQFKLLSWYLADLLSLRNKLSYSILTKRIYILC